MKARTLFRGATLVTALLTVLSLSGVALADVWTDKWEYTQGETVSINGDGMWGGEAVSVEVFHPDGSLAQSHEVQADAEGNFAHTYVLPDDAPGGIYDVVATGQESGNVYTAQFDPPVSMSLSLNLSANPVTYGDSTTISGTLSPTGNGGGKSIAINRYTDNACTSGASGIATPTTSNTGGTKGDHSAVYLPTAAGTQYVQSHFAGETGNPDLSAASSPCTSLTINKANTTTTATPSATAITLGSSIDVDWSVSSGQGVTGNTATGTVSIQQVSGPVSSLGCAGSPAVSAAQTTGVGFMQSGTGGSSGTGFTCTPTAAGTYVYRANFADTDGNYNDSSSTPDSSLLVSLTVIDPITIDDWHYHWNGGEYTCTAMDCPVPSTDAANVSKSQQNYVIHLEFENTSGGPLDIKVQGGLTVSKKSTQPTYSVSTATCAGSPAGSYTINISKNNNVVTWKVEDVADGDTCELEVDLTGAQFGTYGLHSITGDWSVSEMGGFRADLSKFLVNVTG